MSAARQASAEPEELELKYVIDDAKAAREWVDATFPRAPGERWRSFTIVDRYFDTADGALSAAGYGARLRRVGGRTILTVKSDVEVDGGLHRRVELEGPASQALAWRRWPESEARARVAVTGDRPLIERFLVRGRRRERTLPLEGAKVIVSIDDTVVEWCGAHAGELRQLEFELGEGDRAALDRIAGLAGSASLLRAESRSKLAMASVLADEASRVALDDSFAEAGRKVLRRHLLRMIERERALRSGDPDALKQMRVATRRLRAAWRVFGHAFRRAEARRYVADTRRVAQALGRVRDMDVLLARLPRDADLEPLIAAWRQRREASWTGALDLLESAAHQRFVRDFLRLTGRRGAGVPRRRATGAVRDEMPAAIAAGAARMQEAAAAARAANDDEAWHALRIAAKRLRYTLESFRDVLAQQSVAAAIEPLRDLQDVLGEMNDGSVAAAQAEEWLSDSAPDVAAPTREAVETFIAASRGSVADQRATLESAWLAVERGIGELTNR